MHYAALKNIFWGNTRKKPMAVNSAPKHPEEGAKEEREGRGRQQERGWNCRGEASDKHIFRDVIALPILVYDSAINWKPKE